MIAPEPRFLPGLELSRTLYERAVAPLVRGIPHAAALLGPGSEVLGLDTPRSTDHDWGPRLQLFLSHDHARVHDLLTAHLPARVHGLPTRFLPFPDDPGSARPSDSPEARHRVEVVEPGTWLTALLGFDPRAGVRLTDWLSTPTQRLAEVTAGAVFHDDLGEIDAARRVLEWYPDDVWRYVLACQWRRIAQEEPFVGRCAEVGDHLGERVVTARLVRDLMRLCLLLGRRYPPYSKWLGSVFSTLPEAAEVGPVLHRALVSATPAVELARASSLVAALQNRTGLAEPRSTRTRPFHQRPYPVLGADRFAEALKARIEDPALASRPLIGAVDQYLDGTDVLTRPTTVRGLTTAVEGARVGPMTTEGPDGGLVPNTGGRATGDAPGR
ncbi:DUF4037 domain-containing protein [Nocardiopsis sp. MG754419]|uniref:DUF4037 domain-containing protein n=1 Tax=Nocardiopsis sp. MG754419 TaxID=2259865 RepID=UPI001BAAC570|nr:DUF4037 domain-containing protein [Nocardiopsis sp. MG754419]MBR8742791.1 hypothetical protein [Nocardiopsis sp. MG754419]